MSYPYHYTCGTKTQSQNENQCATMSIRSWVHTTIDMSVGYAYRNSYIC